MKRLMVFVLMTLLMLLPALVVANASEFTTFDPPGSITTYSNAINPAGVITGGYYDASSVGHGFVRAPDGTLTTFDVPGAIDTAPLGINPAGAITGFYYDASSVPHGFLWIP
ncbi:MAG: hypothetical protein ACRERE_31010 [Candidatus Entotheonellia bacterium]